MTDSTEKDREEAAEIKQEIDNLKILGFSLLEKKSLLPKRESTDWLWYNLVPNSDNVQHRDFI